MQTTGDQFLVKKINKSIVLEKIRTESPLSRAQVSELTGLNKGTVSALVGELIGDHLVYEIGLGQSSGGRKPVMLHFHKTAGYAVGIELGVTFILTVLTDLEGHIVAEQRLPLDVKQPDEVFERLVQQVRALLDRAPQSPYGIIGIGIGVPGIVDASGTILFAPNLQWESFPLKIKLEQEFGLPVTIDNEANVGALGEKQYGAGQTSDDLIYLSVSTGVGSGIILGGRLFRGASGFSGEIGHTSIEVNGRRCSCGNRGCLELYASEGALLEQAASMGIDSFDQLVERAEAGAPEALQLFRQTGEYLGIGIANIINSFNPGLILIGGQMVGAEAWLRNPVQRVVRQRSLPYHREGLEIRFASLKMHSAVLGAAYYAISAFLYKDRVTL
ncbi:ROK family protein [Paenibacillus koleovorans]|uniref:ROK family protein n=1 Tax=Paenibacillus koleovorans TaxID=121608 RepID=UPI000FDB5639|nr:ROK family protein [Paenibacillus koleovorans]